MTHKKIVVIVSLLGLGLLGGIGVGYFVFRPGRVTVEFGEAVLAEWREAQAIHNNVINCRSMIGENGSLRKAYTSGWWESLVPQLPQGGVSPIEGHPATFLVFVHGYNNNLDRSVYLANAVWRQLQVAINASDIARTQTVAFYTFCWRGDFGEEAFGTAETAATRTAPSLVAFLAALRAQAPVGEEASIVLISHSLGAKVCLEALKSLWQQERRTYVKCLMMIQPAIPVESVCQGSYAVLIDGQWVPDKCRAEYLECFQAADRVIATVSYADSVLGDIYRTYKNPLAVIYSPHVAHALGAWLQDPNDRDAMQLVFAKNLTTFDFSPGKQKISIKGHSDIVNNQSLFDWLWKELAL